MRPPDYALIEQEWRRKLQPLPTLLKIGPVTIPAEPLRRLILNIPVVQLPPPPPPPIRPPDYVLIERGLHNLLMYKPPAPPAPPPKLPAAPRLPDWARLVPGRIWDAAGPPPPPPPPPPPKRVIQLFWGGDKPREVALDELPEELRSAVARGTVKIVTYTSPTGTKFQALYDEATGAYYVPGSRGGLVKKTKEEVEKLVYPAWDDVKKLAYKKAIEELPPGVRELVSAWIAAGEGAIVSRFAGLVSDLLAGRNPLEREKEYQAARAAAYQASPVAAAVGEWGTLGAMLAGVGASQLSKAALARMAGGAAAGGLAGYALGGQEGAGRGALAGALAGLAPARALAESAAVGAALGVPTALKYGPEAGLYAGTVGFGAGLLKTPTVAFEARPKLALETKLDIPASAYLKYLPKVSRAALEPEPVRGLQPNEVAEIAKSLPANKRYELFRGLAEEAASFLRGGADREVVMDYLRLVREHLPAADKVRFEKALREVGIDIKEIKFRQPEYGLGEETAEALGKALREPVREPDAGLGDIQDFARAAKALKEHEYRLTDRAAEALREALPDFVRAPEAPAEAAELGREKTAVATEPKPLPRDKTVVVTEPEPPIKATVAVKTEPPDPSKTRAVAASAGRQSRKQTAAQAQAGAQNGAQAQTEVQVAVPSLQTVSVSAPESAAAQTAVQATASSTAAPSVADTTAVVTPTKTDVALDNATLDRLRELFTSLGEPWSALVQLPPTELAVVASVPVGALAQSLGWPQPRGLPPDTPLVDVVRSGPSWERLKLGRATFVLA